MYRYLLIVVALSLATHAHAQPIANDPYTGSTICYEVAPPTPPPPNVLTFPPNEIHPVRFGEPAPLGKEPKKDMEQLPPLKGKVTPDGTVDALRLPFEIVPIPELGQIIIRARNAEDLKRALDLIELLRTKAEPAQPKIKIVPVRFGDPVSITTVLNQFLSRVNLGQNTLQILPPRGGGGGTPAAPAPIPGQPGPAPAPLAPTTAAVIGGPTNVVLIPLLRPAAILVAAPSEQRLKDIEAYIRDLDQPVSDPHNAVPFPLKRASAIRVAAALNNFYAQRFIGGGDSANQIRITWDDGTNTVFVQAGPADLAEIRRMIEHIDNHNNNGAVHELRLIKLKNAVATDLAFLLQVSIGNNTLTLPQPPIAGVGVPIQQGVGVQQATYGPQAPLTKDVKIRWFLRDKDGKPIESGILEDIRISPDQRTNSIVLSAPEKTMPVLLSLINELDSQPIAKSHITVFSLKKIDALQTAAMLQQLFTGTGIGTAPGTPAAAAGGQTAQIRPLTMTITGQTPDGAPIIDLRITVDERTNSLIVAGSRNDVNVVEALIARIESADVPQRMSTAIRLRNQAALDVANALNDFVTKINTIYTANTLGTPFHMVERSVALTAEPVSNSILVNATPDMFEKMVQLVSQLDTTPPQVVIQVLVAEVTLIGSEEFGVEIGLQDPLLFRRGVPGTLNPTGFNGVAYQTIAPGFDFANPNLPALAATGGGTGFLSNQNALLNASTLGVQGINNLGVGRVSPTSGIGGFVFSAGSDSINVLIRALKIQDRLAILSRPQVMTLDKQVAYINVGKNIPLIDGFQTSAVGNVTPTVTRKDTGVTMQVTPQITPDGRVLMRIIPDVSSVGENFPIGNGFVSPAINQQHLETTVAANDGETIMIGGLITKREQKTENKIPFFGDLPGVGALFRYRQYKNQKTELIIIMTPHIVRSKDEADQILCEETRRINWATGDVMHIHAMRGNPLPFMGPMTPSKGTFPPVPGSVPESKDSPFRIYPESNKMPSQPSIEFIPSPARQTPPKTSFLQTVLGSKQPANEPLPMGVPVKNGGYETKIGYGPAPASSMPALPTLPTVPAQRPAVAPNNVVFPTPAPASPGPAPLPNVIVTPASVVPPPPMPMIPAIGPSLNGN